MKRFINQNVSEEDFDNQLVDILLKGDEVELQSCIINEEYSSGIEVIVIKDNMLYRIDAGYLTRYQDEDED